MGRRWSRCGRIGTEPWRSRRRHARISALGWRHGLGEVGFSQMQTRLTSEQRDGRQLIDWRLTALVSVGTAVELGLAVLALATRLWWPAALLLVSLAPS